MLILQLEQTEVDYCPACGGIWLDAGELEILLKMTSSAKSFLSSFHSAAGSREKNRKCPVCQKNMEKVLEPSKNPVLMDRCPIHGLWFDQGELVKILEHEDFKNPEVLALLKNLFAQK